MVHCNQNMSFGYLYIFKNVLKDHNSFGLEYLNELIWVHSSYFEFKGKGLENIIFINSGVCITYNNKK